MRLRTELVSAVLALVGVGVGATIGEMIASAANAQGHEARTLIIVPAMAFGAVLTLKGHEMWRKQRLIRRVKYGPTRRPTGSASPPES